MKTTNILLGAGFLVGGYLMIDYFSKPKTLVTQLETGDFVEPEATWNTANDKSLYFRLKKLRQTGNIMNVGKFDLDFTDFKMPEELKLQLDAIDWSTVDLDKINNAI
jgi:hypothetical protein